MPYHLGFPVGNHLRTLNKGVTVSIMFVKALFWLLYRGKRGEDKKGKWVNQLKIYLSNLNEKLGWSMLLESTGDGANSTAGRFSLKEEPIGLASSWREGSEGEGDLRMTSRLLT